jgi:hypothetical protein
MFFARNATKHKIPRDIKDIDNEIMSLLENLDSENFGVRLFASDQIYRLSLSVDTATRLSRFQDRLEAVLHDYKDKDDPVVPKTLWIALSEVQKLKK